MMSEYGNYSASPRPTMLKKSKTSFSKHLANLLQSGDKIGAIRYYRDKSECSLTDAKRFIDNMMRESGFDICSISKKEEEVQQQTAPELELPAHVERVQGVVMSHIDSASGDRGCQNSIMQFVKSYPDELVVSAFGQFGEHFLRFCEAVYDDHPSLTDINHGTLLEGGKVYNRVSEILQLTEVSREKGFVEIPSVLCDWFNRNHGSISKIIRKPPPRLLIGVDERKKARCNSGHKDISLLKTYEIGRRKSWDMLTSGFLPYCRMGPGFEEEIAYLKRMSEHANKLGMSSQSRVIKDDASNFDAILADQYMGFVRLKMTEAAMIAAKSTAGMWDKTRNPRISLPASLFKSEFWNYGSSRGEDPMLYELATEDHHVRVEANYKQRNGNRLRIGFSPRAYPVDRFVAARPARVRKLLDKLDAHVDGNGRALFDNYWIIVPSVTVNSRSADQYEFRGSDGVVKFNDYWEYAKALDRFLVETGQIFPVILGEHVSRKACYFIGYWA